MNNDEKNDENVALKIIIFAKKTDDCNNIKQDDGIFRE